MNELMDASNQLGLGNGGEEFFLREKVQTRSEDGDGEGNHK